MADLVLPGCIANTVVPNFLFRSIDKFFVIEFKADFEVLYI